MKIAILADCHLNKGVYRGVMDRVFTNLPFRQADFLRSLEWIVDECINNQKPDMMVMNGDIYDNFEPSNEIRGFFSAQLRKMAEAKIPVIILTGNHDVCRRHHALKDIKELGLKSIRVIDKPMLQDSTKHGYRFLFFPYSLDMECKNVTTLEEFERFKKSVAERPSEGLSTLFFGHFGVQGDVMNEYFGDDETDTTTTSKPIAFINRNSEDISLRDLDTLGADYVFLGDFHNFHMLATKTCRGLYSGSIEKNSYNEINQRKGFVMFDDSLEEQKEMGYCRFVEYPNCRPMLELKGSFDRIKKEYSELDKSEYQNAIIKVSFIGTSEELVPFSTGMDSFKTKIIEETNAIHVFQRQSVIDKHQEAEALEVERELEEKGHMEAEDVIDVVHALIAEKISDKQERKLTSELAVEIYKQSMEKI